MGHKPFKITDRYNTKQECVMTSLCPVSYLVLLCCSLFFSCTLLFQHLSLSSYQLAFSLSLISPATCSLWDTHNAAFVCCVFSSDPFFIIPFARHTAVPLPPPFLTVPLGASLTSSCTPTSETERWERT